MGYLESNLGDGLVEGFTLNSGHFKFELRGLTRTVRASKGSSTPGRSSMYLLKVGIESKCVFIAHGYIDDSVVGKGGHGIEGSDLLTSTGGSSGNKDSGVLTVKSTLGPETSSGIPKSLPLGREVSVSGGDSQKKGVVRCKDFRTNDGIFALGRRMHLGKNLLRKSFGDLEKVGLSSGRLDTSLDGLGQTTDMSVHGVVDDSNLGGHCELDLG